jgi:hypothetical protein
MSGAGEAGVAADALREAKALLECERAEELRQLDLLEPPTAEEMLEAKEELGLGAGRLAVLRHAREKRRQGRPPGARNKRTDDFSRWLLSQGRHPGAFMMEVVNTPVELLMEASGKSYLECLDRKIRCAEGLMPFLESKKPVAADISLKGDIRLIEEITDPSRVASAVVDGEFVRVLPLDEEAA